MRYKVIGYLVWQGGRWYVRRRVARLNPSHRIAAATAVIATVGALALVAAQRSSES